MIDKIVGNVPLPRSRGMKPNAIASMIKNKAEDWLKSLPKDLRTKASEHLVVTGGCIASMLIGERPNDFDFYFRDLDTVLALADHYVTEFLKANPLNQQNGIKRKIEVTQVDADERYPYGRVYISVKSSGIATANENQEQQVPYVYFENDPDPASGSRFIDQAASVLEKAAKQTTQSTKKESAGKYHPIFLSGNAITLWGQVQLVLRFIGDPKEIHRHYDFVHCTNYWTRQEGLTLSLPAVVACMSRTLEYQGSLYPLASLIRLRKFIQRGWNVTAGQILKIATQVHDLDLYDVKVLEDQLMGVDQAYFRQLMAAIQSEKTTNPDLKIDGTYIAQLIDSFLD